MSINAKLTLACLGFLAISIAVGIFTWVQERNLGSLSMTVYDKALIGVNYARKVQTEFVRVEAALHGLQKPADDSQLRVQLADLLDDLDVATERAMTAKSRAAAVTIRARIAALAQPSNGNAMFGALPAIDTDLGKLVDMYTADGFTYRIRTEQVIADSDFWLILVSSAAIVLSIAIAFSLRQAILPPIGNAVRVAVQIASGRLDNKIETGGRSETSVLLRSLDAMQTAIAAHLEAQAATQAELLKRERLSALGQLTATVAHELRNPLSAIRNTFVVIEDKAKQQGLNLERLAERIDRSIGRCDRLINDLLDYTRGTTSNPEPIALDAWLKPLIEEQTIPQGIIVEQDLCAPRATISIDPDRFRRVIINVLENAMQALNDSAQTERRITIRTSDGAYVASIVVEDNGPGIDPDVLPRIFEPLFSTKSFGTGLGLPTVKQIVDQHQGQIEIASEKGSGTTVRIDLPHQATTAVPA